MVPSALVHKGGFIVATTKHFYSTELYIEGQWCDRTFDVEVDYTYTPGYPEQGPSYASGGEPACLPEIEIIMLEWRLQGAPARVQFRPLPKELWSFFVNNVGRLWEDLVEDAEHDRG